MPVWVISFISSAIFKFGCKEILPAIFKWLHAEALKTTTKLDDYVVDGFENALKDAGYE